MNGIYEDEDDSSETLYDGILDGVVVISVGCIEDGRLGFKVTGSKVIFVGSLLEVKPL